MEEGKVKIVGILMVLLVVMFVSFTITGCGTLRNGRGWGQDAIYPLDLGRIPHAASHAFFDLETLIPTAGALVFNAGGFDRKVSDWATRRTPIFGSNRAADNAYSPLTTSLKYEWLLTVVATPSGENPKDAVFSKMKGFAVGWVAQQATSRTTSFINDQTGRIRPDGSDNRSFPSSGSTNAFTYATLANRNLDSIPVLEKVKVPLKIGNILLATTVAWSRVEAGKHFPSDVLVGAALGHFITAFIYDAFMGLPEDGRFALYVSPSKHERMIGLAFVF
jgi:membrane-associated phospholipid phosphatase